MNDHLEQVEKIFAAMAISGIYVSDFAKLTGISRTSLYKWRNGEAITDKIRLNLAASTADRLAWAVEKKRLPLSEVMSAKERVQALKRIVMLSNQEMRP